MQTTVENVHERFYRDILYASLITQTVSKAIKCILEHTDNFKRYHVCLGTNRQPYRFLKSTPSDVMIEHCGFVTRHANVTGL